MFKKQRARSAMSNQPLQEFCSYKKDNMSFCASRIFLTLISINWTFLRSVGAQALRGVWTSIFRAKRVLMIINGSLMIINVQKNNERVARIDDN